MIERHLENPVEVRSNLIPNCGNCDFMLGYREHGWCGLWSIWVWGHQDCPSFELRNLSMTAENIQISTLLDGMHSSLTILAELAANTDEKEILERFRIAELAMLKFLKALREQYNIGYEISSDEDV